VSIDGLVEERYVRLAAAVQPFGDEVVEHLTPDELLEEVLDVQPLRGEELLRAEAGAAVRSLVVLRGEDEELPVLLQKEAVGVEEGLLEGVPRALRAQVLPVGEGHQHGIGDARSAGAVVAVEPILPPLLGSERQHERLVEEAQPALPHGVRRVLQLGGEVNTHLGRVVLLPQRSYLAVDMSRARLDFVP